MLSEYTCVLIRARRLIVVSCISSMWSSSLSCVADGLQAMASWWMEVVRQDIMTWRHAAWCTGDDDLGDVADGASSVKVLGYFVITCRLLCVPGEDSVSGSVMSVSARAAYAGGRKIIVRRRGECLRGGLAQGGGVWGHIYGTSAGGWSLTSSGATGA